MRRLASRAEETDVERIAAGRNREKSHAKCGCDASNVQARLDTSDPDFPGQSVGLAVPLKGRRG